jgi:hypothetical protein
MTSSPSCGSSTGSGPFRARLARFHEGVTGRHGRREDHPFMEPSLVLRLRLRFLARPLSSRATERVCTPDASWIGHEGVPPRRNPCRVFRRSMLALET